MAMVATQAVLSSSLASKILATGSLAKAGGAAVGSVLAGLPSAGLTLPFKAALTGAASSLGSLLGTLSTSSLIGSPPVTLMASSLGGFCSCGGRSPGRGGCARGAGRHGLHGGRNHRLLLGSQDDVSGCHCQRGRGCSRQPGSDPPVCGGWWTLLVIQSPSGHRGVCPPDQNSGLVIAPCHSYCREEDLVGPCPPSPMQ
ncbi:uncharacterized protein LOC125135436 isoform X1 [Phacochoerus africanus]|uniref:uncharacterized protein LOC125135436 isoform X1 n=1 Tax=Phacochoerus africanus TaxID=41426 RepID=UPI001FD9B185|nr:uncharacterized protein LOC125135436 isoform X1 [Phacochoerus africanus]